MLAPIPSHFCDLGSEVVATQKNSLFICTSMLNPRIKTSYGFSPKILDRAGAAEFLPQNDSHSLSLWVYFWFSIKFVQHPCIWLNSTCAWERDIHFPNK